MTGSRPEGKAKSAQEPSREVTPISQLIVARDLTLSCSLGVSDSERAKPQRIRINLEVAVDPKRPSNDRVGEVVDYGRLVRDVRRICLESKVRLLETLAAAIAETCFQDDRVLSARVRIEKLDRYSDVGGIGVELHYERPGA